jgi:nitroreductase
MDTSEAITGRRSVREYTKEDIQEDVVSAILDAGRWAPSGLNNQPWRFMVLRGAKKDAIARYTKYGDIIRGAPVCVAVFFDDESGYSRTKDLQAVGACIQNILLRIHDLGLGGVWLGEILNRRAEVEKELDVGYELMAVIAFGRPTEKGGSPERKELGELII